MVTKQEKSKQGKNNKRNGARFENLVRKDLENKGWIVFKNSNNVSEVFEQDIGEYIRRLEPAKHKFNPYKKIMSIGNGFPDFVCTKFIGNVTDSLIRIAVPYYDIIGVEAKTNGYLDKEERLKCSWLLEKKIFSKILIASKEGKEIKYKEFENG